MKCRWSKLDEIEADFEKVNLKNFNNLFSMKQVVNNEMRVRGHLLVMKVRFYLLLSISFTCLSLQLVKYDAGKK